VPLQAIATVQDAKGPNIINRENAQRRIVIQANVSDRDLVGVVQKVQAAIDSKVHLPQGYYVTYGGQFESQASASRLIALLSLFSLAGMFMVLYVHFKSANLALTGHDIDPARLYRCGNRCLVVGRGVFYCDHGGLCDADGDCRA
jgi:Cu/Ag efflux pump CusA